MAWFSRSRRDSAVRHANPMGRADGPRDEVWSELSKLDGALFDPLITATDLDELLRRGANPNVRHPLGYPPLHHWISWHGDPGQSPPEMVAALLRYGADPNGRNADDYTPLDWAAYQCRGRTDVVDAAGLLIGRGARVNSRDSEGGSPLHTAANMGADDMVEFLLRSGAYVDARTKRARGKIEPNYLGEIDTSSYGATPLHFAARSWHTSSAAHLLDAGADPNATRGDGLTPLQIVRERRAHYAAKRPGQPDQETYALIENGCAEFEELLLRYVKG
jgi:ankyrin repeat protein